MDAQTSPDKWTYHECDVSMTKRPQMPTTAPAGTQLETVETDKVNLRKVLILFNSEILNCVPR